MNIRFNGLNNLARWLLVTDAGNRFLEWFGKKYFNRIMATSAGAEFHELVRKEVEREAKKPIVVIETHPDGFIRVYAEVASVRFVNRIETYQSCEPLDEERCLLGIPLWHRQVYLNERCLVACENIRLHPQTLSELLESKARGGLFHAIGRDKLPRS